MDFNETFAIACALAVLSRIVRTYGVAQEERGPMDRPMIWDSEISRTLLSLLVLGLLGVSLYIAYTEGGFMSVLLIAGVYLVILPVLDKPTKKFLDKIGI